MRPDACSSAFVVIPILTCKLWNNDSSHQVCHPRKKGPQPPCYTEQFARSVATIDRSTPASNALWHASSLHQPADGVGATAQKCWSPLQSDWDDEQTKALPLSAHAKLLSLPRA